MVGESCNEDGGPDDAGAVHLLLRRERGFLQRLGLKETGCDDDKVEVRDMTCGEKIEKVVAGLSCGYVDRGDVNEVLCYSVCRLASNS